MKIVHNPQMMMILNMVCRCELTKIEYKEPDRKKRMLSNERDSSGSCLLIKQHEVKFEPHTNDTNE